MSSSNNQETSNDEINIQNKELENNESNLNKSQSYNSSLIIGEYHISHMPNLPPLNTERHPHKEAPKTPETPTVQVKYPSENENELSNSNPLNIQDISPQISDQFENLHISENVDSEKIESNDQNENKKIQLPPVPNIQRFNNNTIQNPNNSQESSIQSITEENSNQSTTLDISASDQVHQHAISMLNLMYPNLPKEAISALYLSTESNDMAEKLRKTMDTLNVIQERFGGGNQQTVAPPTSSVFSTLANSIENKSQDHENENTAILQSSWFYKITNPIKNKIWKQTDESTSKDQDLKTDCNEQNIISSQSTEENVNTSKKEIDTAFSSEDILIPEASQQTWLEFFKQKLHNAFPYMEVTNNSERNIAISTFGPMDMPLPVKTISSVIRMIMEGTIKLQKSPRNGGKAIVRERLGPGVVVTFSLVPSNEGDYLSGNGWCDIGFRLTTGIGDIKLEYPRDFKVTRLPLHAITYLPYGGPYVYFLARFVID